MLLNLSNFSFAKHLTTWSRLRPSWRESPQKQHISPGIWTTPLLWLGHGGLLPITGYRSGNQLKRPSRAEVRIHGLLPRLRTTWPQQITGISFFHDLWLYLDAWPIPEFFSNVFFSALIEINKISKLPRNINTFYLTWKELSRILHYC